MWLVVKILLSGGIRGAKGTQMENKSEGQADKTKQACDKAACGVLSHQLSYFDDKGGGNMSVVLEEPLLKLTS